MAKPKKKPKPPKSNPKSSPRAKGRKARRKAVEKPDVFDRINAFLQRKANVLFWVSFVLTIIFGFLLFEMRTSLTGDDSAYIIRASRFFHDFTFPSFQGPLYPILLSPLVGIFDINLIVLKALSFVFILGHLFFFHKAYKEHIPKLLHYFMLFLLAINAYILYYASQTYNEALFMFLQMIFLAVFFKRFIHNEVHKQPLKESYTSYLLSGFLMLLLVLTKNIGYGSIIIVMLFFAFYKEWKAAAFSFVSFVVLILAFEGLKTLIWPEIGFQLGTQGSGLLQKNYYDPSEGNEDLMGFIGRFLHNSKLFISKHFYMFIGWRPDNPVIPAYASATIFTYLLFIGSSILIYVRKNKYLFFTAIYAAVMMGITFIILQKTWDQGRLILPFFPMAMLVILSGFYYLAKTKALKFLQPFVLAFLVIVFFSTFARTGQRVEHNRNVLKHNLQGDMTYGFSPDWVHYIQMSKWAAQNIPEDVKIAARKPTVSFIYSGGREYHGIYRIPTQDADSLLMHLSENNVKYVIVGSIRKYAQYKTEYTVNTVARYLYFIQQEYPDAFVRVHQIGGDNDEPASLVEIKYERTNVPFGTEKQE